MKEKQLRRRRGMLSSEASTFLGLSVGRRWMSRQPAGGRLHPAALPEVAPPLREHPRADGVLEREAGEDAPPQVLRQLREVDHRGRL
jgi:hypothetical protein